MNNLSYLENLYSQWKKDPTSVDQAWNCYFQQIAASTEDIIENTVGTDTINMAYRQSRVDSLLWAYRDIGYLYAHLNPLGGDYGYVHDYIKRGNMDLYEKLSLEEFGISADDLDTVFSAGRWMQPSPAPLREILDSFRKTYCGTIGVEFLHIQDKTIRHWLIEKMESRKNQPNLSNDQKLIILKDLIRTETLERSIQQFFMGQKRFSLEGSEGIIPGLHFLVDSANRYDIEDFVIGATHRGRLSILNTVLEMSPEQIFSLFEENSVTGIYGREGDVKYHIGFETDHLLDDGGKAHICLCANASHVESINPIVQGRARALQDKKGDHQGKRVLPILLHGDAAFSGQGIVCETLNLSQLEGYKTGGTIHIIINNQIGFTTSFRSGRSSYFPTDAAKGFSVPIFHVNGDDPEAFVYVVDLALQIRQQFSRDCIIDVFCFRRHGHNETDEPSFTHPRMYKIIEKHPGIASLYGEDCAKTGVANPEEQTAIRQRYTQALKTALSHVQANQIPQVNDSQGPDWFDIDPDYHHDPVDTTVQSSDLMRIADHLMAIPEDFIIHPIIKRVLAKKREAINNDPVVDWSMAESLAFGSLMLEGSAVRLSGEDSVRGTFSQRHLTWWDMESETPHSYTPLNTLPGKQAELWAYDSPLSEYSILGFEYGYSLVNPQVLVIWEAQFGDFANGAQVTIDNYIVSAESKWRRSSGLVLLLPHGSEGQGPDHTSGRLERFLDMAAGDNIQIYNLTTPAQYFHALRRQIKAQFRKPLVIMSPKSLLRHPKVISTIAELSTGTFQELIDDQLEPAKVEKLLLCSGKVYYDFLAQREAAGVNNTALIRIEQLFPFPYQALKECLKKYGGIRQVIWAQEEPRNFGAWKSMQEHFKSHFPDVALKYYGRKDSAISAPGLHKLYQQEQKKLVEEAFMF